MAENYTHVTAILTRQKQFELSFAKLFKFSICRFIFTHQDLPSVNHVVCFPQNQHEMQYFE